jgi:hypothetical protein
MRGCVLHGKVVFASAEQNAERKPVKAPAPKAAKKAEKSPARPRRGLPF